MQINGVLFSADLEEILLELQTQLHINGIDLLAKIQPTNNNVMLTCPYHSDGHERRPSAGINKTDVRRNGKLIEAGTFYCLACHETHSLQEVISYCFGHTDDMIGAFGWNWLLKNFATLQVEERKDVKFDILRNSVTDNFTFKNHRMVSKNKSESGVLGVHNNSSDTFVSDEELDSYRYTHPYAYKRGLTDEVIELFDIGYDSNSDCITFPVRDVRGNTLFIARRSTKTKYFNYPDSAHKPLYGLYEISQYCKDKFPSEVIVCESMLDALSFWTVGKIAVALNGTGSFSQYKELRELPCRELVLCTDMDKAGMGAREKLRKNVKNKIISEYFLPDGCKDANDCTKEQLLELKKVY